MTAHRTAGQLLALRELCALARTATDVCDELQRRGAEESDAPRLWLLSLERWTRGEETGPQLAARTRAMETWREAVFAALPKPAHPNTRATSWGDALHWLSDARADMARNPGHRHHVARVVGLLTVTVWVATKETTEEAEARVANLLDAHVRGVHAEWVASERAAMLRQAKADKAAAERALGTLPGME